MGFFKSFDKVDGAVNRGYARWVKWLWGVLLLPVVIYLGWAVWAAIWGPPSGPVTLIIHSELDRPILEFSVNGMAGGMRSRVIKAIRTGPVLVNQLAAEASAGIRQKLSGRSVPQEPNTMQGFVKRLAS
jgi:peptidoglycan/LPS O-acetylase OafA/YrhL